MMAKGGGRPQAEINQVAKQVEVHLLVQQHRRDGSVSTFGVARVAGRLRVSVRTVWRWLEHELKPTKQPQRRAPKFEHTEETLAWIRAYRAIRPAHRHLRAAGLITCGENAFYSAFHRLEPAIQAGVLGGMDKLRSKQHWFDQEARATHRNARWEIDNCLLPMFIWSEIDAKLVRPWLTVVVDVTSRVIMGFAVTCGSDVGVSTESVMCALAEAILGRSYDGVFIGGLPESVGVDLGPDYTSNPLYIALQEHLGVDVDPAPRETPEDKPIVEAAIQYIERNIVALLPGFEERLAQKKAA
jgi:transposase InsO family protein